MVLSVGRCAGIRNGLYHPQRILYPQLRVGKKGAGDFRRIDWDEALDILATRLKEIRQQHGGESILPYSYAGNMGAVQQIRRIPLVS